MRVKPTFGAITLAACLGVLFVILSLSAVRQKAPTFDETLHLFAGYAYLKWGDFGINPEHPPLAKIVGAIPLLVMDLNHQGVDRSERDRIQGNRGHAWELANRFLFIHNDAETIFLAAKAAMTILAVALGVVIYLWARDLYGLQGAVVGVFIFCLDPNFLAHSAIVHTDVPFTLWFFAATYFFWRSLNELSWSNLLLTATFFALAAITKFSFVSILPIWMLLGLIRLFVKMPQRSRITEPALVRRYSGKSLLLVIILGAVLLGGYVTIWLTYGLRFDASPYPRTQLPTAFAMAKQPWLETIVRLSGDYLFLPDSWIFGIADAFRSLDRPAYLLGEISKEGFWLYFPVAFLAKTPAPTLILLMIALVYLPFAKRQAGATYFLLVSAILFFAIAVWSHINIGIRHIMPIYPFLFVWLGGIATELWGLRIRALRTLLIGLSIWLFGSTIASYPDYLAYFNELAGGAKNGHRLLVDSNLDWGQDLKGLKTWMEQNSVTKIQLAYFGMANPNYYGIQADYLPGTLFAQSNETPSTEIKASHIAISATYLMGYNLAAPNFYASFRQQKPLAVIGHSIWVFKLPD